MRLIDINTILEEIEDTVTSVSFCGTVEAARSAHETKDRILSRIKELPAVDAVPLDKLCEWLAEHYGAPCQLSEIDCYPQCEPDENGECYGMRTDDKKCWHDYLTKWMDGSDAD